VPTAARWLATRTPALIRGKLLAPALDDAFASARGGVGKLSRTAAAIHRRDEYRQCTSSPRAQIGNTPTTFPVASVRRLARRGGPHGAANAAQRCAHVLGIGRRLQVGEAMGVTDGGAARVIVAARGSPIGLVGKEGCDRGRRGSAGGLASGFPARCGDKNRPRLRDTPRPYAAAPISIHRN
jgi:hypothetical protein